MINRKIHKQLINTESKAHKLYANIKTYKKDMPVTPEINNTEKSSQKI